MTSTLTKRWLVLATVDHDVQTLDSVRGQLELEWSSGDLDKPRISMDVLVYRVV